MELDFGLAGHVCDEYDAAAASNVSTVRESQGVSRPLACGGGRRSSAINDNDMLANCGRDVCDAPVLAYKERANSVAHLVTTAAWLCAYGPCRTPTAITTNPHEFATDNSNIALSAGHALLSNINSPSVEYSGLGQNVSN